MLDIGYFSTIIYILYEGGELKPPVASLITQLSPLRPQLERTVEGPEAPSDARVSVPGGSHTDERGALAQAKPT